MLFPALYLLFELSPIRADGLTWAAHYMPFQVMVLVVTWLQSGGFRMSAIVASIGAAPVHARALWATLRDKPARWSATNQTSTGTRSLWVVMPQLALALLNATGIVVGLVVMADPAPTWLSVAWATMITLILGRIIVESVRRSPEEPPPVQPPPAAGAGRKIEPSGVR
jgi:cellulose synthase (UDP-forming)